MTETVLKFCKTLFGIHFGFDTPRVGGHVLCQTAQCESVKPSFHKLVSKQTSTFDTTCTCADPCPRQIQKKFNSLILHRVEIGESSLEIHSAQWGYIATPTLKCFQAIHLHSSSSKQVKSCTGQRISTGDASGPFGVS